MTVGTPCLNILVQLFRGTKFYQDVSSPLRFAQFFICPLFNADAKDREVNAVDSGERLYHLTSPVPRCTPTHGREDLDIYVI